MTFRSLLARAPNGRIIFNPSVLSDLDMGVVIPNQVYSVGSQWFALVGGQELGPFDSLAAAVQKLPPTTKGQP